MMIRRIAAALLVALMLCGPALAEDVSGLTAEAAREIVEALFAAAAGTTRENEENAREGLVDAQISARNEENALYRAAVLPWLMEALCPGGSVRETAENETDAPEGFRSRGNSYEAMLENEQGRNCIRLLESLGGADAESCMEISRAACALWMAEVNHEALEEMNPDYACWLYVPGTKIDYPVAQGQDNSRYLHRMFNGERNSAGTLFIDYRNLPGFQDPNTLVYGHHMRNDSMFGSLTDYARQACYEARPYGLVMQAGEILLVEFFAGYTTTDGDACYDIAISDDEDLRAFAELAREKSDFSSEVQIEPGDRLVTLSTCAYAFENARYILIGRLVSLNAQENSLSETAGPRSIRAGAG